MDEATRCDRVALIQQGRVLAIDAPQAIGRRFPRALFAVRAGRRAALIEALHAYPHTASAFPFGDAVHFSDARASVSPAQVSADVLAFLQRGGFDDARVEPIEPGVEDAFMELMGEPEAGA